MSVDETEMMNEETLKNIIRTKALGRPFRLGMLYDRYHDNIIPGETLLRMEDMDQHTFTQRRNGYDSIYQTSFDMYKMRIVSYPLWNKYTFGYMKFHYGWILSASCATRH